MGKIFLVLLATSLLLSAKAYKDGDLVFKNGRYYEKSTGKTAHGILETIDEDEDLRYETPFKRGYKDGLEKVYHLSGELSMKTRLRKNKKNGTAKGYYRSGKRLFEVEFNNDKLTEVHIYSEDDNGMSLEELREMVTFFVNTGD